MSINKRVYRFANSALLILILISFLGIGSVQAQDTGGGLAPLLSSDVEGASPVALENAITTASTINKASDLKTGSLDRLLYIRFPDPLIPIPQTPRGYITDRTPKYTWTKVSGATNYRFQLKKGTAIIYTNSVSSSACGLSTCSNTPITVLGYNTYKWRVRARVGGVWKPWSAFKTFAVVNPIPTPKTPSGVITDPTPKYTWTKVTGATNYRFQLKKGTAIVYTKSVSSSICGHSNCSNTPATLLGNNTFNWRVRARVGGVWKPWSSFKTFTVNNGFNSTFNANKNGWKIVNGTWTIYNSKFLKTNGLSAKLVSVYYDQKFTKLNYQVRMKRFGNCTECSNILYIRGTPQPTWTLVHWDKGYYFAYTNGGTFGIWVFNNGSPIELINWTTSAAINKGGWNTLKVVAWGSTLKFYINNTLVWTGNDSTLTNGFVGVSLHRNDISTGDKLYVDWAKLTIPGSSPVEEQVEAGQVELEGGTPFMAP